MSDQEFDLDFEKEYMRTFDERKKEIEEKVNNAIKALDDVVKLSEKYSIPFNIHYNELFYHADVNNANYMPTSLVDKKNLYIDKNISKDNFSPEMYEFLRSNDIVVHTSGWEVSNVC